MAGRTTIRDVARVARVSVGTVSATMNGTARVSEKLARRVRLAVSRVGYSPDGVAQSLRLGRTRTIGLVVSDVCNPFFASLARSVEAAVEHAGYSLILCNTDEDPERELRLLSVLRMQRVAGVIFSPSGVDAPYRERLAALARPPALAAVLVDRTLPGLPFDAVTVDNVEAGRLATEHLIRLGHRRIAIVSGRPGVFTAEQRLAGYRESLARHRLPFDERLVVTADFRAEIAHAAVQRLLARPRPPTAILAANNLMTMGTIQAVLDMGFRCPEDMSIAGIDDFPWSAAIRPRLTTVAQPIEDMGRIAAARLLEGLETDRGASRPPPQVTVLAPRLLVRDSCRRYRTSTGGAA